VDGSIVVGDDVTRATLFCLFAAFVAVSAPAIAQDSSARVAEQPFLATIQAEFPAIRNGDDSYTLKAGSELFINVRLTNCFQAQPLLRLRRGL